MSHGKTGRTLGFGLVSVALVLLARTQPALASDNVVLQWNATTLAAVRNTRTAPPIAARALSIVHTSMYDAWAAYDTRAVGTRLGGSLRRPAGEHTVANKEAAISFAAYRALVDLFPTQVALFDTLMARRGYDPEANSGDASTPPGTGNAAAAAVIAFRHGDGANQLGDLHPGAYSDYTMYAPINGADTVRDPNRWQPLRMPDGRPQRFLTPHWGLVVPFALACSSQYRPPAPPLYPDDHYRGQAEEMVRISAALADREKAIAEYWADGPSTETPPGHWNLFAQFVSRRDGHSLDHDVKMFFALGNAVFDASIAVWEAKRLYDYARPVTAIHLLFGGKKIPAWGGPFRGTRLIDGEDWTSYLPTPPFAEFVSGHSAFSAASAEILKAFTGSDAFGATAAVAAGSSRIEPGLVPATHLTLSWATFSAAADEAGISRRFGGIHFEESDLRARSLGRRAGALVWEKARAYFDGAATQRSDNNAPRRQQECGDGVESGR